jgi:hypothetical protein
VLATAFSRPPLLTIMLLLLMGALFVLAGMWLTLQFRWIQVTARRRPPAPRLAPTLRQAPRARSITQVPSP